MKRLVAYLALLCLPLHSWAIDKRVIPSGSKVFVESSDGFEIYLAAAFQKKKVPLVIVGNRERADFILEAQSKHEEKNWASKIFLNHRDTSEAAVRLIRASDGEVVWAYAVHKKNSVRAHQSTAEACAKHIKEMIR